MPRTSAAPFAATKAAANGHAGPRPALAKALANGHAKPAAAPAAEGVYEPTLPLKAIVASKTNPRATFDEAALDELAASIREKGVLEPILVRRWKAGAYELVAGERRLKAAERAGLATIPAIVKELTDTQALEVQVIENLQREGLSPLEEAEGFERLRGQAGYTAEQIATKLGKAKTYVYAALKLCGLPKLAAAKLAAGVLPKSTAELIARIPDPDARERAAKAICSPKPTWQDDTDGKEPLTFRRAKELIEAEYMVELKRAPFPLPLADLPGGSCAECPKRTGNAKELFPGSRADVCTDPTCFAAKAKAWRTKQGAKLMAEGHSIFAPPPKEEAGFWRAAHGEGQRQWRLRYGGRWVDLDETTWCGDKSVPWRSLLKELPAADVTVAFDPDGHAHFLVPHATAQAALDAVEKGAAKPGGAEPKWKADQRKEQAEVDAAYVGLVVAAAEKAVDALLGMKEVHFAPLVRAIVQGSWGDLVRKMQRRRGVADLTKAVGAMDRRKLFGVLAEVAVWRGLGSDEDKIGAVFGVTRDRARRDVAEARKAKAEKKGAKSRA